MRIRILGILAALLLLATAPAGAKPPTRNCDDAAIAAAQALVMAACPCDMASTHGQFVSCAARVVNEKIQDGTIGRDCRRTLRRGAAHSTCGKLGFVTCCRARGPVAACGIRHDRTTCETSGGCVGATASCMDACVQPCGSPSGAFLDAPALF